MEGRALSVAGFEDPARPDAPWRIEILDREPPDEALIGRALLPVIGRSGVRSAGFRTSPVAATDWQAVTREQFPPQTIGRFWVHGSHVEAPVPPGLVGIRIDAGLAFGSGEHASTRGCLLALDDLARRRRHARVLDLGCGTGILAIAAAKCWPTRVIAADNDPAAVRVCRENLRINGTDEHVRVVESDGVAHPWTRLLAPYDLIFANILADPLIRLAPALSRLLDEGGTLVLSGLLEAQAGRVADAYKGRGLKVERLIGDGAWATLLLVPYGRARRASLLGAGGPVVPGPRFWRFSDGG